MSRIPQKPFLKSAEIARIFNVNHSTVFLWVKKKKIHPMRTPGGNFRFHRREVERLYRERNTQDVEVRIDTREEVEYQVPLHERIKVQEDGLRDTARNSGMSFGISVA